MRSNTAIFCKDIGKRRTSTRSHTTLLQVLITGLDPFSRNQPDLLETHPHTERGRELKMRRSKTSSTAIILTSLLPLTTASPAQTPTAAILTEPATTVTAFEVSGTSGLAVIGGTTYSFRGPGLTLHNGDVVSVLFDGIADKTTTDTYGPVVQQVPSPTFHNPLTFASASTILGASPSGSASLTGVSVTIPESTASSGAAAVASSSSSSAASSSASASASASSSSSVESSNMGTTQSIGGGKVVALVGALAAVVLCGL